MTENEAIKKHIEECEQRIGRILNFISSSPSACKSSCEENINILKTAIIALEKQIKPENMSKDKYIKESDLFKAMENNSHMVEVFGKKRKMIDGILLTYDIAEFERLNVEEIRAKAIDDFAERVKHLIGCEDVSTFGVGRVIDDIDETAKQMKGDMQ